MKTDTKHGFIITYFKTSQQGEDMLRKLITTLSKENYYLILASHSPIPMNISSMCDFSFYQELNIIDDRKYSHGVAESNLIELSLLHLKYKNINWSYKMSYDVDIIDVSQFDKWIMNYDYDYVSCNWGNNFLCTNSFFTNVNFILENITFYKTIDEMFAVNTVLENCWQHDIERRNLEKKVYSFIDKQTFFGPNKIDNLYYNYNDFDFWYIPEEMKFYVRNNGPEFKGGLRIFDYYTDLCVYLDDNFQHGPGVTMWIAPPNNTLLTKAKNGFYLEIYFDDVIIRKNIHVHDFEYKDPLYKKFKNYKNKEVKINEYWDFNDLDFYSDFTIDISNVKNFVDIGACYGFASLPFLNKKIKTYMIDADISNIELLKMNFSNNSNIEIIYKAICDFDGTIDFYLEQGVSVISSIFQTNALGSNHNRIKIETPAITPNTLIENHINEDYIDLMKIDIEGAEYKFFESITSENLNKIKTMLIEYHNNDNREVLSILEKLTQNDFFFKIRSYWKDQQDDFPIDTRMGVIYAYKK